LTDESPTLSAEGRGSGILAVRRSYKSMTKGDAEAKEREGCLASLA